jgi:molybdate transport system ATP-binding protein
VVSGAGFEVEIGLERRPRRGPVFRLETAFRTSPGVTVVFGPSGAGKTTLLLAVLGALTPERGRIRVGDRTLFDSGDGTNLAVRRRRLGIVFQDALLFPHLDVAGNVGFGLTGMTRARRRKRVLSVLERRGAGGRALAPGPSALLLDEPFSALDAPSRRRLADMLARVQRDVGVPFLHVTHDLPEAVRLGSELVVLEAGRVTQVGPAPRVVAAPSSAATARALGTENLFRGVVRGHAPRRGTSAVELGGTIVETGLLDEPEGAEVALGLRAEDILLAIEPPRGTSARNVLEAEVLEVRSRGTAMEIRAATPVVFRVLVTLESSGELDLRPGRRVHLLVKAHAFHRLA